MSTWTIEVNGVTRTPQGWGIDWDTFQIQFGNWEPDVLTFAMSKATVLEEPVFAYRDPVIVYKGAVKWFVGRIVKPSASATSVKEVQKYVVKNVAHDLESLVYEQERNTKTAADGFTAFVRVPLTRVVLGSRLSDGVGIVKVDTKEAVSDLIAYAMAEGLELQSDIDFAPITPPYEEGSNLTVAAAIRRMISWTPDAAWRWDYTTNPPTLYIRRRATETPITLDLLDSVNTGLVEFPLIDADYDLVPSGVEISVQSGSTNPADGLRYALVNRSSVTISGGAVLEGQMAIGPNRSRLIRGTIKAAGDGSFDAEEGLETLATEIANALKELFWNCELRFKHREVPGVYRPGKLINFTNGQTAWATAKAIVQEVLEIPARGVTVVRCGRPPWLSRGTIDEINGRIAAVRNPTDAVATFYPGYSTEGGAGPDVYGPRIFNFDLNGYRFGGPEAGTGSAVMTVQLTSRVSCNITCSAFTVTYLATGLTYPLNHWESFDMVTLAPVGSGGLGIPTIGHPTGRFYIKWVIDVFIGPAWWVSEIPNAPLLSDLKSTIDASAD